MCSPASERFLNNHDPQGLYQLETSQTSSAKEDASTAVFVTNNKDVQVHSIIVGLLIGIILFLSMALLYLIGPPLARFIRSKIPVSQKRMNRRYETIERWLISKVSFS
jgi:hypothetical protein